MGTPTAGIVPFAMATQPSAPPVQWGRRLGEHLEKARQRALLSRADLALRVGVTEESIRRWERGGARPSAERLAQLITVLAIDAAQFSSLPDVPEELPPLARSLRRERVQRGLSQAQAGKVLGLPQPTYAGWEIGRALPSSGHVSDLAEFLAVSVDEVTGLMATPFVVDTTHWPPLGQLVGARREALRLTRDELARLVGVAPGTVVAWELGYRTPRAPQLRELAEAIQVDPSVLEAALPQHEPLSSLGELIRTQQHRLGLRLRDIADRARLDESTLSRWLHGRHEPELSSLMRLAQALELPFPVVRKAAYQPA
jgi:transcriptional regulator with XRE-family HTH domain